MRRNLFSGSALIFGWMAICCFTAIDVLAFCTQGLDQQDVRWTNKEDVNRLVIVDVRRHLDAFLNSSAISKIDRFLKKELKVPGEGIHSLRRAFDANQKYFPRRVSISENGRVGDLFSAAIPLSVVTSFAECQELFPDEETGKEIQPLLVDFLNTVKVKQPFRATVTASWEDKEVPSQLFESAKNDLPFLLSLMGFEVQKSEEQIRIKGDLGNVLDYNELVNVKRFVRKGWLDKKTALQFEKMLSDIKIDAILFQKGNSLVFCFGKERKLDAKAPFKKPVDTADASVVAFGTLDNRNMKKLFADGAAFCGRWMNSRLAKQYRRKVSSDEPAASMKMTLTLMGMYPDSVVYKAIAKKNSFQIHMTSQGKANKKTIIGSGIERFLPEQAKAYQVDVLNDFGKFVSYSMLTTESRMDRATESGDFRQQQIAKMMAETYYENFAIVRSMVNADLPEIFQAPYCLMLTPLNKLGISVGKSRNLKETMSPGMAVVAKVAREDKAREVLLELSTELTIAFLKTSGFSVSDVSEGWFRPLEDLEFKKEIGLDSGTKVWCFDSRELEKRGVELKMEGDFRPHFFFHSGFWIFSTSKSFSKLILKTDHRLVLEKDVASETVLKGEEISEIFKGLFGLLDGLFLDVSQNFPEKQRFKKTQEIMETVPKIFDRIVWKSKWNGEKLETKFGIFVQDY